MLALLQKLWRALLDQSLAYFSVARWIITSCIFVGFTVLILAYGRSSNAAGIEGTLLALNLSVAVLAINFSFVAYQSSPYRQFQKGLAPNLLFGCLLLLAWATTPICALVFVRKHIGLIILASIPITGLLALGLVALAKYEGSPRAMIRTLSNHRAWRKYLQGYARAVEAASARWKKMELAKSRDMPTHEWGWSTLPVPKTPEPFGMLGSIGCIASKEGDVATMSAAAQSLLSALDEINNLKLKSDVRVLTSSQIARISRAVEEHDETGWLASRFLDIIASYATAKATEPMPPVTSCAFAVELMIECGERLLARGDSAAARIPLVVVRQICQSGLYRDRPTQTSESKEEMLGVMWDFQLESFAQTITRLGHAAIEAADSEYLYRVFDAYGWLGCSAVKVEHYGIAKTCLRGLAQLGREARAKKLECHWDRCSLLPVDHAGERIDWILSWTAKLDESKRSRWMETCAQAFSRLKGHEMSIRLTFEGDKPRFEGEMSKEPYVESFSTGTATRTLDYSDYNMLKDFELYGFGTVMQGPIVPIAQEQPKV